MQAAALWRWALGLLLSCAGSFAWGDEPFGKPPKNWKLFPDMPDHKIGKGDLKPEQFKKNIEKTQEDQFKLLDKNGDGVVYVHEVEEIKKKLEARVAKEGKDKLQKHESSLLDKLEKDHIDWHGKQDKDGNGHFTLEEYKQLVDPKKAEEEAAKKKGKKIAPDINITDIHLTQKLQFEVMDGDNDGRVSKQEMVDIKAKLKARKEIGGEKALAKHEDSLLGKLEMGHENIHTNTDVDGDGLLTWEEYKFKKPDTPKTAEL